MRKENVHNAAYEVATQVRALEDSIDAALVELAELQTRMIHARGVTGAGFANSHPAFEPLAAIATGLIAARGSTANCHEALAETRKTIPGLRTVAWGDTYDCPDPKGSVDLRVVA
jgi:hypothetical protein